MKSIWTFLVQIDRLGKIKPYIFDEIIFVNNTLFFKFKLKFKSEPLRLFSSLKNGTKIMMMGSVEQEIKDMSEVPTDLPTVINDFDEVMIRNYFFLIM